ncbi:hypothetical protein K505DRAFT_316339 [Melanomma pulvis-pyrius CBS 109.77]|uniref:Rhodopsin domain-containing protein n=1 Tax=Melanomma pulvis-pyrius CBS 109.77 TaxID=1314802 RepID=A0A6A6WU59_9PLEO|nr:hypothetical protein K505DRAFT_316339 [Melanomma pulvis-pyrius CBS 109.77]
MSYGGDEDRRSFLLTTNWVFFSISLFLVTLRLVSRRMLEKNKWQIDDGLIILAIFVILLKTIWMTVNVSLGYGRHLTDLLAEDPVKTMKWARSSYGINAFAFWTFTLPKLPVVALLVRLFEVRNQHLGKILWTLLTILIIWNTLMTIVTFVQCTPVEKNWHPMTPGTCWNPKIYLNLGYFSGAYSATLDFIFALYPILQVSKLQMETSRKIIIAASFSLGIPAGVVTLYKLTTIETLINQNDPTFATVPLDTWNCVECIALITAATIPMTRPIMSLVGRHFKEVVSRISGWSSTGSRDNTKTSKGSSTMDSGARMNQFSQRNGYRMQKSHDDILLQESRLDNV